MSLVAIDYSMHPLGSGAIFHPARTVPNHRTDRTARRVLPPTGVTRTRPVWYLRWAVLTRRTFPSQPNSWERTASSSVANRSNAYPSSPGSTTGGQPLRQPLIRPSHTVLHRHRPSHHSPCCPVAVGSRPVPSSVHLPNPASAVAAVPSPSRT